MFKTRRPVLLCLLVMFYITSNIICDPLFFREIYFTISNRSVVFSSSALVYPLIYILCDIIYFYSSRRMVIIVILFGIIFDGLFSISLYFVSLQKIPHGLTLHEVNLNNSINILGGNVFRLWYQGLLASIIAAFSEIFLFKFIFTRSKSFFLSTFFSVILTILMHNLINDYNMYKTESNVWTLILANYLVNVVIILFYVLTFTIIFKIKAWQKPNNTLIKYFSVHYQKFIRRVEVKAINKSELSLCEHKLFIDATTCKPYFSIIERITKTKHNLCLDEWLNNTERYEKQFSKTDCSIMLTLSIQAVIERYQIERELVGLSVQVAHDMGSPIIAMGAILNQLHASECNKESIMLLADVLKNLNKISQDLVNRYRYATANNVDIGLILRSYTDTSYYILLSEFINRIVSIKKYTCRDNCIVTYTTQPSIKHALIYLSPMQLERALSNLLNNALDSLLNEQRELHVTLALCDGAYRLTIQDTGIGVPADRIPQVLNGCSLKHEGDGLGLASSKKYIESVLGGKFDFTSVEGVGTTVTIDLPLIDDPVWFSTSIPYADDSVFVVLDDDPSVLLLWQKKFMQHNIKNKYIFNYVEEFDAWYKTQALSPSSIILLIDYDLHHKTINGVELIKQLNIANSYLVTGVAEDPLIQQMASEHKFKLIPKQILCDLQLIRHQALLGSTQITTNLIPETFSQVV